jgi:hypothetical protein
VAAECQNAGLEFIPGTELTAEHDDSEIHLLAYFIEVAHPRLLAAMARFQAVRQDRVREIVARLRDLNITLEAETVFALANCRSPGRPHVARALVDAGVCEAMDEAFERFLKRNRPAWVPKFKMSVREGIQLIHEAGGLAIMAHPGLSRTDGVIPAIVADGLDGIECFHTKHSTATVEHYLEIADRYHLLVTGGSDCHGGGKGKPLIGTVKLPYQHVEKLKEAVRTRSRPDTPAPR